MSEAAIFQIGAAIFVVVTTAVLLYGYSWFRSLQQPDDRPGAPATARVEELLPVIDLAHEAEAQQAGPGEERGRSLGSAA